MNLSFIHFLSEEDKVKKQVEALQAFLLNNAARRKPFEDGDFPLFSAQDKEVAEALVYSMTPHEERYLLKRSECGHTALHFQCMAQRVDVVEYLLSFPTISPKLVYTVDDFHASPLHMTSSTDIAKLLLQAIDPNLRDDYILLTNGAGQTAIHIAVKDNNVDMVTYLMSEINDQSLLLNNSIQSPLHCAESVSSAKCFVDCTTPELVREFLLAAPGMPKYTALHQAAMKNNAELVKYFLSIESFAKELIFKLDLLGETALHVVTGGSAALALMESAQSIKDLDFKSLLKHKDVSRQSACHTHALYGRGDVLQAMLNFLDSTTANELLNLENIARRTPLHFVTNLDSAKAVISNIDTSLRKEYILRQDQIKFTSLSTAAQRGCVDVVEYLLTCLEECIDSNDEDDDDISMYLAKKTYEGDDVYQLAYRSQSSKAFHELFEKLDITGDSKTMIKSDHQGNNPLLHVAAMSIPKAFAQTVMSLPLAQRKQMLKKKNPKGANCKSLVNRSRETEFDLSYYVQKILGVPMDSVTVSPTYVYQAHFSGFLVDTINPPTIEEGDRSQTWKIMHYAINEFSAKAEILLLGTQGLSLPKMEYMKAKEIENLRGQPKAVIFCTSDSDEHKKCLIPPNPDYMMVTVHMDKPSCQDDGVIQLHSEEDVNSVLARLLRRSDVKSLSINSTYGRQLQADESAISSAMDHLLITKGDKRKALVICNSKDRPDYEKELKDASIVLETQLGFSVEIVVDLSATEMINRVKAFGELPTHGTIIALAIMSHGDSKGNICGNDGSVCSVQSLFDTLTTSLTEETVKLFLLGFCRGNIVRKNRTKQNWECNELFEMEPYSGFNVEEEELPLEEWELEWNRKAMRSLNLSLNSYVCYSTMPDSRSKRGEMFKAMREHLKNLYRYHIKQDSHLQTGQETMLTVVEENSTSNESSVADIGSLRKDSMSDGNTPQDVVDVDKQDVTSMNDRILLEHDATEATSLDDKELGNGALANAALPNVQLLELLTDVSSIVRESSSFTQYMNFCYSVNKDSKTVWLEIDETVPTPPVCFTNFESCYLSK